MGMNRSSPPTSRGTYSGPHTRGDELPQVSAQACGAIVAAVPGGSRRTAIQQRSTTESALAPRTGRQHNPRMIAAPRSTWCTGRMSQRRCNASPLPRPSCSSKLTLSDTPSTEARCTARVRRLAGAGPRVWSRVSATCDPRVRGVRALRECQSTRQVPSG